MYAVCCWLMEERIMKASWTALSSNEDYQVLRNVDVVVGWVVKIDGQWVARSASGTVRADFDTIEEAKDFLTTIIHLGEHDEEPMR